MLIQKAIKIVKVLEDNGFTAYFAGGSVRDMLLNKEYNDIDIATSAKPADIIKLFRHTIKIGVQFGVVIVVIDKTEFEVATFREDGEYYDGRRPSSIRLSDERGDVYRRDFTINGMLYDPLRDKIIDYVGGRIDLKKKSIKCIGEPRERFKEDNLRVLRAIRFASTLSYRIEDRTWKAIKEFRKEIHNVSIERIRDELFKILLDNNADKGILLLDESGLLEEILPELHKTKDIINLKNAKTNSNLFSHTILMLKYINKLSKSLAFASLLLNIGKTSSNSNSSNYSALGSELAIKICKRFSLSNAQIKEVVELVRDQVLFDNAKNMSLSNLKRFIRGDNFAKHLELHRANRLANNMDLSVYDFCRAKLREYRKDRELLYPARLVTGKLLIELGLKPGPSFKQMLWELENAQLEGIINTKDKAISYIKNVLMSKHKRIS